MHYKLGCSNTLNYVSSRFTKLPSVFSCILFARTETNQAFGWLTSHDISAVNNAWHTPVRMQMTTCHRNLRKAGERQELRQPDSGSHVNATVQRGETPFSRYWVEDFVPYPSLSPCISAIAIPFSHQSMTVPFFQSEGVNATSGRIRLSFKSCAPSTSVPLYHLCL